MNRLVEMLLGRVDIHHVGKETYKYRYSKLKSEANYGIYRKSFIFAFQNGN